MIRTLVLLSGGIDSTVALAVAIQRSDEVVPLLINYGQRNKQELIAAQFVADYYRLPVKWVTLQLDMGSSALLDEALPLERDRNIEEIERTTVSSYVPCRNSMFLAIAASHAEALDCESVYIGLNSADASGHPSPDGRYEFVRAMELAIIIGSKRGMQGDPINLVAPCGHMRKAEAIKLGMELKAPLHLTRTCFESGVKACQRCDACVSRVASFAEAGIEDPALKPHLWPKYRLR